jgi:hypothetical protein
MGADYIVNLSCAPKLAFGNGDAIEGTRAMVDMIKARSRARALAENVKGKDPNAFKVTVVRATPEGQTQEQISYADLLAQSGPLDAHASACQDCPANFLGEAYGCYGTVPYPVTAAGERWLVNRLQTADSPGGFMLLSAIRDFNYDGAPVRRMRAARMFALEQPAEKVVQKKFLGSTRVNGDQIFQAFFFVGGALAAGHCSMLLIMLGALEIDGRIPAANSDAALLTKAMRAETSEERLQMAKLDLRPADPEAQPIRDLLRGAYRAWVLDVELLMDA